MEKIKIDFNPHSPKGVTTKLISSLITLRNFNPHSPKGVTRMVFMIF